MSKRREKEAPVRVSKVERMIRDLHTIRKKMPPDFVLRRSADLMRILGDRSRLKLVFSLSFGRLCVNDLSRLVSLSQSATSHQLRLLRTSRVVSPEKEGKKVYYVLTDDAANAIVQETIGLLG